MRKRDQRSRTAIGMIPGVALAAALAGGISGCNIRPDLGPPGTVYYQRHRAVVHDPFPSRTIAPDFDGARPREYDRPLAEPMLNQTNPHARNRGFGFLP